MYMRSPRARSRASRRGPRACRGLRRCRRCSPSPTGAASLDRAVVGAAAGAGGEARGGEQGAEHGRQRNVCDEPTVTRRSSGVVITTLPSRRGLRPPPRSFADLYRATVPDVFAYVATILGDRGAAEDVVAAGFERAYRKRRSFDRAPRQRARLALRDRAQRGARRAAPAQAHRALVAEPAGGRRRRHDEDARPPGDRPRRAEQPRAARPRAVALKFHGGLTNAEVASCSARASPTPARGCTVPSRKLREACA